MHKTEQVVSNVLVFLLYFSQLWISNGNFYESIVNTFFGNHGIRKLQNLSYLQLVITNEIRIQEEK